MWESLVGDDKYAGFFVLLSKVIKYVLKMTTCTLGVFKFIISRVNYGWGWYVYQMVLRKAADNHIEPIGRLVY